MSIAENFSNKARDLLADYLETFREVSADLPGRRRLCSNYTRVSSRSSACLWARACPCGRIRVQ